MVNKVFDNPDNEEDVVFKKSRFITAHEYGHYILHKSSEQTLYAHRDNDNFSISVLSKLFQVTTKKLQSN